MHRKVITFVVSASQINVASKVQALMLVSSIKRNVVFVFLGLRIRSWIFILFTMKRRHNVRSCVTAKVFPRRFVKSSLREVVRLFIHFRWARTNKNRYVVFQSVNLFCYTPKIFFSNVDQIVLNVYFLRWKHCIFCCLKLDTPLFILKRVYFFSFMRFIAFPAHFVVNVLLLFGVYDFEESASSMFFVLRRVLLALSRFHGAHELLHYLSRRSFFSHERQGRSRLESCLAGRRRQHRTDGLGSSSDGRTRSVSDRTWTKSTSNNTVSSLCMWHIFEESRATFTSTQSSKGIRIPSKKIGKTLEKQVLATQFIYFCLISQYTKAVSFSGNITLLMTPAQLPLYRCKLWWILSQLSAMLIQIIASEPELLTFVFFWKKNGRVT